MTYSKPEVNSLGDAIKAIQSTPKSTIQAVDNNKVEATAAYEDDE